jgi:hypothetical protein
MAVVKYDTAGNIVNRAAKELKLGTVLDPFGSTDPNFQQLCAFLVTCGQKLCKDFEWGHLTAEGQILTDGVNNVYALPGDFQEMIPQTGWDRTKRMPLMGPLLPQQWQYLKAWQIGITVYAGFRLQPNEIWLWPIPPPSGILIGLEYRSSAWVIPNGVPPGNYNSLGAAGSDAPVVSGDICLFDPYLLSRMLKLYWRSDNGFDTTASAEEFNDAFEKVTNQSSPSQTLSLNGPRLGLPGQRMIDGENVPITGVGGRS